MASHKAPKHYKKYGGRQPEAGATWLISPVGHSSAAGASWSQFVMGPLAGSSIRWEEGMGGVAF